MAVVKEMETEDSPMVMMMVTTHHVRVFLLTLTILDCISEWWRIEGGGRHLPALASRPHYVLYSQG